MIGGALFSNAYDAKHGTLAERTERAITTASYENCGPECRNPDICAGTNMNSFKERENFIPVWGCVTPVMTAKARDITLENLECVFK